MDFVANLAVSTIDWGTFHMYPESWGYSGSNVTWMEQWIADHITAQNNAGKPCVLEEYGLETDSERDAYYPTLQAYIQTNGLAADHFWQFGPCYWTSGDDYIILSGASDETLLVINHAQAMLAKDPSSSLGWPVTATTPIASSCTSPTAPFSTGGATTTTTHTTTTTPTTTTTTSHTTTTTTTTAGNAGTTTVTVTATMTVCTSSSTTHTTTTTTTTAASGSCSIHYAQCGGIGWTGPTCCVTGYTCTYSNAYYSQCL